MNKSKPDFTLFNRYYKYGFVQKDVDFLIPNLASDHPFCIDPFLLFKSKKSEYQKLHSFLLGLFGVVIHYLKKGDEVKAFSYLNFQETNEIALGYTQGLPAGRGCGAVIQKEIYDLYLSNPRILEEGLSHIEEMQLYCPNIAEDRISDISINIIKKYLIEYTQQKCLELKVNTKKLVINNIYDYGNKVWIPNDFYQLPENPFTGKAIIFAPLDLLRYLPWINYPNYYGYFAKYILPTAKKKMQPKLAVVKFNRAHADKVKKYIKYKEKTKHQCKPVSVFPEFSKGVVASWLKELDNIKPGKEDARKYEKFLFKILPFLLHPKLTDGEEQVREDKGVHIRDIIFYNSDENGFWFDIKNKHNSTQIVFELKNTKAIIPKYVDQLNRYLADFFGDFGLIVTRNDVDERIIKNVIGLFSGHRKVVLFLSDKDIKKMIDYKLRGAQPFIVIRKKYMDFTRRLGT